ncbi:MAG: TRAP transporter large permease subunit [Pseudomonadota bacterium]
MGPTLQGFGMDLLAAHMFVFFFGVAAGITPPVALTAFAAASVSGGRPIATAVASTRIGAMPAATPKKKTNICAASRSMPKPCSVGPMTEMIAI